jgi:hypothetical protein
MEALSLYYRGKRIGSLMGENGLGEIEEIDFFVFPGPITQGERFAGDRAGRRAYARNDVLPFCRAGLKVPYGADFPRYLGWG